MSQDYQNLARRLNKKWKKQQVDKNSLLEKYEKKFKKCPHKIKRDHVGKYYKQCFC